VQGGWSQLNHSSCATREEASRWESKFAAEAVIGLLRITAFTLDVDVQARNNRGHDTPHSPTHHLRGSIDVLGRFGKGQVSHSVEAQIKSAASASQLQLLSVSFSASAPGTWLCE